MARRLRVLLDLSMARRGYCGIAQDVRLLYKTLASCRELEVTGLVYPPQKLAPRHRFRSPRAPRHARVANQSAFLWQLASTGLDWRTARPWRHFEHFLTFAETFLARRATCDLLHIDSFGDAIWRMLFSRTLPASDMPLVTGGRFALANFSDGMVFARALTHRRPVKLDTRGYDFLIVQGPRPIRASRGTRQIVRYHDMIPLLVPDAMGNPWVIRWHHEAIRESARSFFVCNSEPTRDDLTSVYPEIAERSATIPYMLSDAYRPERNLARLRSILRSRRSTAAGEAPRRRPARNPRYLMCVSTLEPRKNFVGLIQAFHRAKSLPCVRRRTGALKLVIVGNPGWDYEPILAAMRPGIRNGEIIHLQGVEAAEMRLLYSHAEALVFPSFAEGFGFPPLEAMQCGTPAIVSDIAAHRWVMDDAVLYCNPYDVASISRAIERLVAGEESSQLRAALVARSRALLERYSLDNCGTAWLELFERLSGAPSTASVARVQAATGLSADARAA